MIVKGISSGIKVDVFDGCSKLTLKANSKSESELLALIMACFTHNGTLSVEADDKLINWIVCDHEWVGHKNPNTPDGPGEWIEYCKHCGMENPGSWVEE